MLETDCIWTGAAKVLPVMLSGAFSGLHSTYLVGIEIPNLSFIDDVSAVGVAQVRHGFDGIACFPFLNRFTYGNFGDPTLFGLEL